MTVPGVDLSWYGKWRVDTTKDIKELLVGDHLCNRFNLDSELINLNDDESISNNY